MKPAHLAILLIILVLGIVNLLAAFGVFAGGSSSKTAGGPEYRVITPVEMDSIGFKAVAEEVGAKPDEEGKMNLPGEKVVKHALLKTTLDHLKNDGWVLTGITPDSLYIFKKG
ncbi:MAG: hypothetical protein KDN19_17735 [Verrucomicrobiae bacterium]|nr:hypothetical protein [Verrucomicrobiae bacterium]